MTGRTSLPMGRCQIGSVAQGTVDKNVEIGSGPDPAGIIVIIVGKDYHIAASRCRSVINCLPQAKGEPVPVSVTNKAIHVCLVCHIHAAIVAVMIGGGMAALADAAVRGVCKNKLGCLLVNNRILHSRYTTLCYGAANKT